MEWYYITDKEGNKHIGAIIYQRDFLLSRGYLVLSYKRCTNDITMKDIIDCMSALREKLAGYSMKLSENHQEKMITNLLSELCYAQ